MNQHHRSKSGFDAKPFHLIVITMMLSVVISHAQDIENLKDAKPLEIKGSLSASTIFFDVNGRKSSRQPFSWLLRGDPIFYVYGIALPVNIVVSEQERDFRQPFNRFGISPTYKWVKLHAGYQNLNFSSYSLAGHAVTGVGVELTPGKLRFAYMHGRLLRAVNSPLVEDQDYRVQPAFKRVGDAIKIGYGTQDNFIDLAILKARDIASSIDSIPESSSLMPAENLVIAVRTEQQFLKKFRFAFEYARSIYTNDTRAEKLADGSLFSPLTFLLNEKTSTESSTALEARLRYEGKIFFGGISFQRIDPNYRSMGAYFFLNDIQKITIDPGVKLFDNRLRIATSYGYQENNLANTKSLKTVRKIGSINVTASLGKLYQFTGNYSNFGVGQKEGFNNTTDPEQQITQVTQNWSMNHNFSLQRQNSMHNLNLMINYQDLDDKNEDTAEFSNYTSGTYSGNYMISLLPVLFSVNAGYIFTTYSIGQQDIRYYGPSINFNKSFLKNKLQVMVGANKFTNTTDDTVTRKLSRYSFRVGYKITKNQKLTLKAYLNDGKTPNDTEKNYTETKAELNYAYHF